MVKAKAFYQKFKQEVLLGIRELPEGFKAMIEEGAIAPHPPRTNARMDVIRSSVDQFAREFAKKYPNVGYLELDEPDDGEKYRPIDESSLSVREQKRRALDDRVYYSSIANEDYVLDENELELELSQDAFNYARFKLNAMKKGLSNQQATLQATRDVFNMLEQREIELNLIREQATQIGVPSFNPMKHLQHLEALHETVTSRHSEYQSMEQRDQLEETLKYRKYYGDTSPLPFELVENFSPFELHQFIAEHPEYKEYFYQPFLSPGSSKGNDIMDKPTSKPVDENNLDNIETGEILHDRPVNDDQEVSTSTTTPVEPFKFEGFNFEDVEEFKYDGELDYNGVSQEEVNGLVEKYKRILAHLQRAASLSKPLDIESQDPRVQDKIQLRYLTDCSLLVEMLIDYLKLRSPQYIQHVNVVSGQNVLKHLIDCSRGIRMYALNLKSRLVAYRVLGYEYESPTEIFNEEMVGLEELDAMAEKMAKDNMGVEDSNNNDTLANIFTESAELDRLLKATDTTFEDYDNLLEKYSQNLDVKVDENNPNAIDEEMEEIEDEEEAEEEQELAEESIDDQDDVENEDGGGEEMSEAGYRLQDYDLDMGRDARKFLSEEEEKLFLESYRNKKRGKLTANTDDSSMTLDPLDFMFTSGGGGDSSAATGNTFNDARSSTWASTDKGEFLSSVFKDNKIPFNSLSVDGNGIFKTSSSVDVNSIFGANMSERLWRHDAGIEYPVACSLATIDHHASKLSPELAKFFNTQQQTQGPQHDHHDQTLASDPLAMANFYQSDLADLQTVVNLERFQDVPSINHKDAINSKTFEESYQKTIRSAESDIYTEKLSQEEIAQREEVKLMAAAEKETLAKYRLVKAKLDKVNKAIKNVSHVFYNDSVKDVIQEKEDLLAGKSMEDLVDMDETSFNALQSKMTEIETKLKKQTAIATLKDKLAQRKSKAYRKQKRLAIKTIDQLLVQQTRLERKLNLIQERSVLNLTTEQDQQEKIQAIQQEYSSFQAGTTRDQLSKNNVLPFSQQFVNSFWHDLSPQEKKKILIQFKQQQQQQLNNNNNQNNNNTSISTTINISNNTNKKTNNIKQQLEQQQTISKELEIDNSLDVDDINYGEVKVKSSDLI